MAPDESESKLDKALKGLDKITKKAIDSADGSSQDNKQKLDKKQKEWKNKLKSEAGKKLINALENQNWEKAENIADQMGYDNKQYEKTLNTFITFKETKGEKKVKEIKSQLESCEKFLEKAIKFRNKGNWEVVEPSIKQAANIFNQIEKNQLLEAQREISQAENAIKHYNRQVPEGEKSKDKEIHKEINEIDKSISQAQEYITDILEALKHRK